MNGVTVPVRISPRRKVNLLMKLFEKILAECY